MKTRAEIVVELAERTYSSYMSGDYFPSARVDMQFVSWMLDADYEALCKEVDDEFKAIRDAAVAKFNAQEAA